MAAAAASALGSRLQELAPVLPLLVLLVCTAAASSASLLVCVCIPLDLFQRSLLSRLHRARGAEGSFTVLPSVWRYYSLYYRHLWREVSQPPSMNGFILSPKRLAVLFALLLLPLVMVWNHIGLALDDVLFPAWRSHPIDDALFVVGNARSGTTWLHRLLAQVDGEEGEEGEEVGEEVGEDKGGLCLFSTFRTWEIVLAVSVTWKRLFLLLHRLDQWALRGLVLRALLQVEAGLVGHLEVHKVGLLEAEEDEWLMAHVCRSQLLSFFFPLAGDLLFPLVYFDDDGGGESGGEGEGGGGGDGGGKANARVGGGLSREEREGIMCFYRDCVRRHLFARWAAPRLLSFPSARPQQQQHRRRRQRRQPIFLSKNPAFTMRLRTLKRLFPSCRAAVLLRDPMQSVPSLVSYVALAWAAFATPTPSNRYPSTATLVDFCLRHYQFPLLELEAQGRGGGWPSGHFAWVPYARLKTSLGDSVVGLLRELGYHRPGLSADADADASTEADADAEAERRMLQRLAEEQRLALAYVSAHAHGVAECCKMQPEELRALLADVYAAMGHLLQGQGGDDDKK